MKHNFIDTVGYKVAYATKLKRKWVDQKVLNLDLTRTQWQVLAWINNLGIPCSQKALLQATEFDGAQLTRVLDQLDKRGVIIRANPPGDRRSIEIHLTKSGHSILDKVAVIMQQEIQILQNDFTKNEKDVLNKLLDKLIRNLKKETK